MKRFLVIALAACAAFAAAPRPGAATSQPAGSETCGIPDQGTLWIDFADGSVPFWQVFARPGVIGAASNFIYPPLLRSYGAKTVYWDMHFVRRVGTPLEPFDPSVVIRQANRMYDIASQSMGCPQPIVLENELNGANLITPWSATNAQYRRNVLIYVQTLVARGARPVLPVPSAPYTGDVAGDWWRELSQYADIVSESYFAAPRVGRQRPLAGGRWLRELFRARMAPYIELGIPTRKLGLMLGFHTTPGSGGREHAPLLQWLEVTKLQALAAQEVAKELGLRSVWSWGWGVWGPNSPENDPDKPTAACVYLWARNPKLCNAPKVAPEKFNSSRDEGRIVLPRGARCTVAGRPVRWRDQRALTRVLADPDAAFTAVYARSVASVFAPLKAKQVTEAERAVVAGRFGGYAAYGRALARSHASRSVARGVIADELRRAHLERRFRAKAPSASEIGDYLTTYAGARALPVQTKSRVPWLGGRARGYALESNAPPQLFRLRGAGWTTIRTMLGAVQVRPLGAAVPLGGLPPSLARPAVVSALKALARADAYEQWLLREQKAYDYATLCYRDQQPTPGILPLTDYLPFLSAD